jgi:hypothetical protein
MDTMYSYLGYEYRPWDDVEEDNIKTFHECYKDGQRVRMPREFYNHSPYSLMTFEEFVGHIQTVEVFIQG